MRKSMFGIAIATLLCAAAVQGQSPGDASADTQAKARSELQVTLLARSDMQAPKPIPVVRPLRFREIPATFKSHGAASPGIGEENIALGQADEKQSEPGLDTGVAIQPEPGFVH